FFSSLFSFGRGLFAFLLFLTLSYALLHTSLQNKAAIVQVAVSTVLYPAQLVVNKVTHWKHLEYDNKVLREINGRLRIENDLLRQNFLRELRLQNLQNRGMEFGDSLLLAEVVARNPGRLQTSLLISLGPQDEDIQRGMPVFTSRGLVGKVSKVFQGHALVQLMTDPLSKVSVLADRTRITGILESPDSRMLYVEFPAHASLQIGDTLVTSGLGGVFPKGMRVGMIRKLLPGEIDVMQKAEVLPFQNPAEVEEVFVLKKEVDWVVRGFVE
ncbi:MAG TPA: rod shape-determining protein MreC, partial [Fibrobacteraceae bacterium]|nr:rod shape-determining protein MreC [Fibrobacteraceae bacterium]